MKTFGSSIVVSLIVVGCFAPHLKAGDREHLGKWHDGPRDMAAWYVCEKADLDGCSEAGWSVFEGSCYAVSEELKSYDDAAAACEAQTAQLVSIQSAEENAHVQSLCKRRACWLGLSEPADSENWFWADGAAGGTKGKWVGYVNWEKGEPNNYGDRDEEATFMNFWGHLGLPPPGDMEHLKVLDRLVGSWRFEIVEKQANGDERKSTATGVGKWSLQGKYLEFRITGSDGKEAILHLFTYDSDARVYNMWTFVPDSQKPTLTPWQWDESEKTLTGQIDLGDGITMPSTTHFIADDRWEYTGTTKDASGNVLGEMKGKVFPK